MDVIKHPVEYNFLFEYALRYTCSWCDKVSVKRCTDSVLTLNRPHAGIQMDELLALTSRSEVTMSCSECCKPMQPQAPEAEVAGDKAPPGNVTISLVETAIDLQIREPTFNILIDLAPLADPLETETLRGGERKTEDEAPSPQKGDEQMVVDEGEGVISGESEDMFAACITNSPNPAEFADSPTATPMDQSLSVQKLSQDSNAKPKAHHPQRRGNTSSPFAEKNAQSDVKVDEGLGMEIDQLDTAEKGPFPAHEAVSIFLTPPKEDESEIFVKKLKQAEKESRVTVVKVKKGEKTSGVTVTKVKMPAEKKSEPKMEETSHECLQRLTKLSRHLILFVPRTEIDFTKNKNRVFFEETLGVTEIVCENTPKNELLANIDMSRMKKMMVVNSPTDSNKENEAIINQDNPMTDLKPLKVKEVKESVMAVDRGNEGKDTTSEESVECLALLQSNISIMRGGKSEEEDLMHLSEDEHKEPKKDFTNTDDSTNSSTSKVNVNEEESSKVNNDDEREVNEVMSKGEIVDGSTKVTNDNGDEFDAMTSDTFGPLQVDVGDLTTRKRSDSLLTTEQNELEKVKQISLKEHEEKKTEACNYSQDEREQIEKAIGLSLKEQKEQEQIDSDNQASEEDLPPLLDYSVDEEQVDKDKILSLKGQKAHEELNYNNDVQIIRKGLTNEERRGTMKKRLLDKFDQLQAPDPIERQVANRRLNVADVKTRFKSTLQLDSSRKHDIIFYPNLT